jgi:prepilin-type N-terminal cleavage/methylation domain-containing protein
MELDPGGELPMRQRGFSVVEVLIATLIFLIIAVGILPLFASSARNNLQGREATEVSNFGRSALEDLLQVDFNHARLTVPGGQTALTTQEYYSQKDQVWKAGTGSSADPALWRRTTVVRQYGYPDLEDDDTFNSPLPGGTSSGLIHIKEIAVEVWHARDQNSLALGGGRHYSVRVLRGAI